MGMCEALDMFDEIARENGNAQWLSPMSREAAETIHSELDEWFSSDPIPYALTGADYMLLTEEEE